MSRARRTRTDRRTEATRTSLIEAAESLFAQHGFDGVSTRQIGAAIGSGNPSVIAYHFGSKNDLIAAVYRHRLPAIDSRRGEMLKAAEKDGRGQDLTSLLEALWLPLLEQTDSDGRHSYARFLAAMLRGGGLGRTRRMVNPQFPNTPKIIDRVTPLIDVRPGPLWDARWSLVTGMVLDSFTHLDTRVSEETNSLTAEDFFTDAVRMARAALLA